MPKKKIFISFDYDHDKGYRYLLSALDANAGSDIEFEDYTPRDIQSSDISVIKAALARKIRDADYTLVIVGKHANSLHPDREEIGERNWQWWEILRAHAEKHSFIASLIDPSNTLPAPLLGKGAKWAHSFRVDKIVEAIEAA